MAEQSVTRKLTAILAADVVGYSRLMEADEAGTLAQMKTHRRELWTPLIEKYSGRVVGTAGDSILVEFASAVAAVECSADMQRGMVERNADLPEERRMLLRVGVNIGEVIVDEDDIYGDGVNVAARLQELAEPGGIAISGNVHEQVQGKLDDAFEDAGRHEVKNITRPIQVWRWAAGTAETVSATIGSSEPLPLPEQPSLAVLPFDNMSGDQEQEYFTDGIVEDIITELSKYSWLLVIARNTTFTFKGASVDIKEVGRQLGVHYVMEGSVRKSGNRVRITAQLVDAQSGTHVWAERYDRELADVFAVQDEITQNVAGAIQPELISAEVDRARRKPPESMAAWDYAVRGRWHVLRLTKEDNAEAQSLLREGLELYPDHVPILAFLSYSLIAGVIFGWSSDPVGWLTEAKELAQRAASLDENDVWVQCALGLGQFTAKQPDKAIGHYKKAIELNPSFALGHGYLALQLAFAGEPDEAIDEAETAIRLSPRDPELFHFFVAIGTAHFVAGRYDEAVAWAEKSVRARPSVPGPLRLLTTSLAHLGRTDEAREVFKRVLEITPHVSATGIRSAIHFGKSEDLQRYVDGMCKAGLPE
ncbi:MAG: adenylate/guanylate cyclase domain-containing protein [Gammaproteobacteria bacterium]